MAKHVLKVKLGSYKPGAVFEGKPSQKLSVVDNNNAERVNRFITVCLSDTEYFDLQDDIEISDSTFPDTPLRGGKCQKVKSIMIFDNGTLSVFNEKGEQIPELQKSWLNFDALRQIAQVMVRDNPEVIGDFPLDYNPLEQYVSFYQENNVGHQIEW